MAGVENWKMLKNKSSSLNIEKKVANIQ